MKLHTKLLIFLSVIFLLTILMFRYVFTNFFLTDLKKEMGERALAVSKTIASSPDVLHAFRSENPSSFLQPYADKIQNEIGAEFIVIGNRSEIRYTHPIPERIGQKMVGGDNTKVFQGHSLISESIGSLGPSLRGKSPVFDEKGNVIGVVSVGFLLKDINDQLKIYQMNWLKYSLIIFIIGVVTSFFISTSVRKALNGFEPKEIAQLYSEQQAILNSIREGIIAINRNGKITIINEMAMKILNLEKKRKILGSHIHDIIPNSPLIRTALTGESTLNYETIICNEHVIVNRVPVYNHKKFLIGAVSSFKSVSEINRLTEELTHTKKYAEGLRAQTHEYSNKLYTISGLIQLESYQEALELITEEADLTQHLVHRIAAKISDPTLAGLILSKFNQASEKKIHLQLSEDSLFNLIPSHIQKNDLITILGNLIDNSIDALSSVQLNTKYIHIYMQEIEKELLIEVTDNGPGIESEIKSQIFQLGVSSKKENFHRGFGLAITKHTIQKLHGHISFTRIKDETIFTVVLPKKIDGVEINDEGNRSFNY